MLKRGDLVMTWDGFIGRVHFVKKSGRVRVHVPPLYRVGSEYAPEQLYLLT